MTWRSIANVGRRSVESPAATGATDGPGQTDESDCRRHTGAAHGDGTDPVRQVAARATGLDDRDCPHSEGSPGADGVVRDAPGRAQDVLRGSRCLPG